MKIAFGNMGDDVVQKKKRSQSGEQKPAKNARPNLRNPDEKRDLDLQTLEALRGAADVKARLALAMSTGTPAISDIAYAVKVRVKEDYKIVEKVVRKRMAGDPGYNVKRLRDMVGLRIVSLYRLDALEIIPSLLKMITAPSDDPTSLFVPGAIEELKIFTTNPVGDAQSLTGRIMDIFEAFNIKELAKTEAAPSNYTSIHMVCWCRGKYRDGYRDIPVEIQVRTALEDVWGEIDHALKYKRKTILQPNMPGKRRLDSIFAHLNVMKTLIDGVAQYADQIKIQLDELDGDGLTSLSTRPAEDAAHLLAPIRDLPQHILHAVEAAVANERRALEVLSTTGDESLAIYSLQIAREHLDEAKLGVQQSAMPNENRELALYVIEMESALVLYELGKQVEGGANLLAEAASIYRKYEKRYPQRALILYRHASTLDALGDRESAKDKFRRVIELIEAGKSELPPGHWILSGAPRYLGTMLWEEAYSLEKKGAAADKEKFRSLRLPIYLEAFRITRPAFDVVLDPNIPTGVHPASQERVRTANNLLYYALEFLENGGDKNELEKAGFKPGEMGRYIEEANGKNWKTISEVSFLDTLRRAYIHVGQGKVAAEISKRIKQQMAAGGGFTRSISKHQADILDEAEKAIRSYARVSAPSKKR